MNNEYELYQIKTSFFMWLNYSYIVRDKATGAAFIIDPAWEIDKVTEELDRTKAVLSAIFLTHSHYDHVNLVNPLIKKFNPEVYMSEKEIDYYRYRCSNLNAIKDREKINIGNTEVLALLTPGHTAGGMCYLLSDSLFTGDTLFSEGCGICNCYGGSATQMFESIQKMKSQIPGNVQVYPGHSYGKAPGQTFEYLTKENIYLQINDKECFINFRMRKNQKGILDFK